MVQFLGSNEDPVGRAGRARVSATSLSKCLICKNVVKREDGYMTKCKGTNLVVEVDGTVLPKHEW